MTQNPWVASSGQETVWDVIYHEQSQSSASNSPLTSKHRKGLHLTRDPDSTPHLATDAASWPIQYSKLKEIYGLSDKEFRDNTLERISVNCKNPQETKIKRTIHKQNEKFSKEVKSKQKSYSWRIQGLKMSIEELLSNQVEEESVN